MTIQTASVDTRDANRDGHLASPDFFDAATYPTITFVATGFDITDDDTVEVTGDLTIKDITKSVDHPVRVRRRRHRPLRQQRASASRARSSSTARTGASPGTPRSRPAACWSATRSPSSSRFPRSRPPEPDPRLTRTPVSVEAPVLVRARRTVAFCVWDGGRERVPSGDPRPVRFARVTGGDSGGTRDGRAWTAWQRTRRWDRRVVLGLHGLAGPGPSRSHGGAGPVLADPRRHAENLAGVPLARPDTWTWSGVEGNWYPNSPLWNMLLAAAPTQSAGFWGFFVALRGNDPAAAAVDRRCSAVGSVRGRCPGCSASSWSSRRLSRCSSARATLAVQVLLLFAVYVALRLSDRASPVSAPPSLRASSSPSPLACRRSGTGSTCRSCCSRPRWRPSGRWSGWSPRASVGPALVP